MKKIIFLLLLFSAFANAQIISFTDANFKSKLLQSSPFYYIGKNLSGDFFAIDANSDGEIQVSEAAQVSYLYLREMNIANLDGIENFTNLSELIVEKNTISSLNISGLTNLTILRVGENNLSTIDVSTLVNLVQFNCEHNQLTTLNVSTLTDLVNFNCAHNQLVSLNTNGLTNLSQLFCNDNDITSLNLTTNNVIKYLDIQNNQLSALNVSNLTSLIDVSCYGNLFTSLSFDNLPSLKTIACGNSLLTNVSHLNLPSLENLSIGGIGISAIDVSAHTGLVSLGIGGTSISALDLTTLVNLQSADISDNQNLTELDFSGNVNLLNLRVHSDNALTHINLKNGKVQNIDAMFYDTSLPSLQFICGDDSELDILQSEILTFYPASNISINSYCSFVPGGNFNTITGSLTFDSNNNGSCDAADLPKPNIKVNIIDGTNQGATFTNNTGNYNFYTGAGNFTITPSMENPTWFNVSPTSAIIPFGNSNNNTATQNFCITPNGTHPDLEVIVAPIVPARPGFDAVYKIVYKNKGNQTLSQLYGVNFFYNENLMDFVSTTTAPATIGSGSLSWSYVDLFPFESRTMYVTLNINAPTDTDPVNIGDELQFTTSILPMAGDESTFDNTCLFNQTVVGAYDPNNIVCMEGNVVSPTLIGQYLHYVINFENTGNFEAENIVVKTEIDPTQFDVSSLRMLNTSHEAYVRINDNKVEFIFENIALSSGGHGNILLKIKSKSNLTNGSMVKKRADIFFDYNAPIDTGFENTVFQALSNSSFNKDNSISIYPNPTSDIVTVNCENNIKSIELFDVQGRILVTKMISDIKATLDLSDKSKGIYFLKITSEKGIKVEKLIRE